MSSDRETTPPIVELAPPKRVLSYVKHDGSGISLEMYGDFHPSMLDALEEWIELKREEIARGR